MALLWRRRWWISAIGVVAAAIVATALLLSPRYYVASAAFVPQESNATPTGLGALAAQFGISPSRAMTTSPQFYADLLQAREVIRDVLLSEYVTSDRRFRGTLMAFLRVRGRTPDETMTRGREKIASLMDVKTNRQTGVVSFEVVMKDPEVSRQVVNRILELVNDYNLQRRQSQGRAERTFAEQRLAEARAELAAAEESLSNFISRNRQFSEYSHLTSEASRLQRRVSTAQQLFTVLAQNYESAKLEEVRNTPVITVIERPEGFVEPKARGTIRKTIIAFLIGAFLTALFVVLKDFIRRAHDSGRADVREFLDMVSASSIFRLGRRRGSARA